jgi:hypothetical protein
MTTKAIPLASLADRSDALLHYIPLLRKAMTMPQDDPQKDEDEHVKEVKKQTGAQ